MPQAKQTSTERTATVSRRGVLAGALAATLLPRGVSTEAGGKQKHRGKKPIRVTAQFGHGAQPWGVATTDAGDVVVTYQGFGSDSSKWVDTYRERKHHGYPLVDEFGGFGEAGGEFISIAGAAVHAGRLFVVDTDAGRLQFFDWDATAQRWDFVAFLGERGSGNGQFQQPAGVAVRASDGALLVSDQFYNAARIRVFLPTGTSAYVYDRTIGSEGSGDGQFSAPTGLAFDRAGNLVVADSGNDRVQVLAPSGGGGYAFLTAFGSSGDGAGQFRTPSGVAVDDTNRILVTDFGNNRVQVFAPGPAQTDTWTFRALLGGKQGSGKQQFAGPRMAAFHDGAFYVADTSNNRVARLKVR